MHRRIAVIAISLFAIIFCSTAKTEAIGVKEVSSILKRLDDELSHRDFYIELRHNSMDSLRKVLTRPLSDEQKMTVLLKLGDNYNAFNTDSALHFYSQGLNLAKSRNMDSIATRFALRRATYLPLLAFNSQAIDEFEHIDIGHMPQGLYADYYDAARQMYFYISSYYVNSPEIYDLYMSKAIAAQSKLLPLLDEGSPRFLLNQGEYLYYQKNYSKARTVLMLLLERLPEEDNLYARASHLLADISKVKGEHHAYTYYLALSAVADTRGATLEVESLQELGRIMYLNGDVGRAYDYMSTALSGAVACNAPLRILQSSQVFPLIENAHKAEISRSRARLYIIMCVMAILLIVLASTLYGLHRKNRQMNRMAQRLEEANDTKDVYIAQFLNLCSIYMDKLNQFNKMVNRKITNGKVDDLIKITKQGKFIEEQSKEFYDVFDDAFLHIYPNFVRDVNELLRPEERIVLREGEKLNTDLRIIAFMRLGIEESTRIAQMLNYSVYTIYTYRNKLKNRALSRDSFEDDVMKIKPGS